MNYYDLIRKYFSFEHYYVDLDRGERIKRKSKSQVKWMSIRFMVKLALCFVLMGFIGLITRSQCNKKLETAVISKTLLLKTQQQQVHDAALILEEKVVEETVETKISLFQQAKGEKRIHQNPSKEFSYDIIEGIDVQSDIKSDKLKYRRYWNSKHDSIHAIVVYFYGDYSGDSQQEWLVYKPPDEFINQNAYMVFTAIRTHSNPGYEEVSGDVIMLAEYIKKTYKDVYPKSYIMEDRMEVLLDLMLLCNLQKHRLMHT